MGRKGKRSHHVGEEGERENAEERLVTCSNINGHDEPAQSNERTNNKRDTVEANINLKLHPKIKLNNNVNVEVHTRYFL